MLPTRRATVVSPFLIAVLLRLGFLPRLLSTRCVASTVGTLAIRLPVLALCVACVLVMALRDMGAGK